MINIDKIHNLVKAVTRAVLEAIREDADEQESKRDRNSKFGYGESLNKEVN
jgi:hypothetical protein